MKIDRFIKYIEPVYDTVTMYVVFEQIRKNPDISFLPIVDAQGFFLGIVREIDLKDYAFGMFGRELIRKEKLKKFIRQCPTVPSTASVEDILSRGTRHTDMDGLIVTEQGLYVGIIFNTSLLAMFDENRTATQRQLAMAQKMEAIGTLAGGIAHDFNNILTPIMGYAKLLTREMDPREEKKIGYLKQITVASERAKELVGQILAFSRQTNHEPFPLSIGSIVKEVAKLLRSSIPSMVQIVSYVSAKNDVVLADPIEIHQILINLCTNAAHAMRESGGILTIELTEYDGKVNCRNQVSEKLDGSFVVIKVSDTGCGISSSIINRIFDPFYTTKKQGEGTGMGLAVVHGTVKRYGGTIDVESVPGKGSTFTVYFPKAINMSSAPTAPSIEDSILSNSFVHAGNCKVLFVDDDATIGELAKEALEKFGFSVITFKDSLQALNAFERAPEAFDIVITDQTMPNLTGSSIARRMLQIRPDLPIILCTGYSEIMSPEVARAMGIREYILKPMDFLNLARLILTHLTPVSEAARAIG